MKTIHGLATVFLLATICFAPGAAAQEDADEAAVWTAVERQWRADQRGDKGWVEKMLTRNFVGWPKESPAPRNRISTRLWSQFNSRQTETLQFELYPQSILVHEDMAIVHYLYTTAVKPSDDRVRVRNGRYTDVLVRVDGDWKFISWHGGDDDDP
jgi:hypothetical protein